MIDFESINQQALQRQQELLSEYLPGGRYQGREYVAGTIRGGDGKSFSLNTETGVWSDFATDEKGGDLVSLVAAQRSISQGQAALELANFLGQPLPDRQAPLETGKKSYQKSLAIPEPPLEITIPGIGKSTNMWSYLDEKGNHLGFAVYRFDKENDKKEFRPLLRRDNDWFIEHPKVLPLFGLNLLAKNPDLPVLVVEGEKAADAGNSFDWDMVVVSWPGGSSAVAKVDLSPLKGRTINILPDADDPGRKAAVTFIERLQEEGLAQNITMVTAPDGVKQGWDIADAKEAGWTREQVEDLIKTNGSKVPVKEEATSGNRNLRFLSAGELCSNSFSVNWLIKGVLPSSCVAMVFGSSGCGKTFLVLDWLLSTAAMQISSWGKFPVKNHGPVFYLCGEGYAGLSSRIKAWCIKKDVNPTDLQFFCSNRAVALLDRSSFEELLEVIDVMVVEHGVPAAICIDTLNRNFGAGDENSTTDMTAFIQAVDEVRNRYGCTVLIVHHTGLSDGNRGRGSSALKAALDCEFLLSAQGKDVRVLECTKSKDSEPPEQVRLKPEIINTREVDEDGQAISSMVFSPAGNSADNLNPARLRTLKGSRKVAMDTLEAVLDPQTGKAHIDDWRKEAYSRGISPAGTEDSKRVAFKRAVGDLMEMGIVNTRDDFYWPLISDKILLKSQHCEGPE